MPAREPSSIDYSHLKSDMAIRNGRVTFGRHGSFPLRFGWIAKGLDAVERNPSIFTDEDATVQLGVGKNMVASIRYWLQAARLISSSSKPKGLEKSPIAQAVFNAHADPYLEDDETIWLLHWLLASNPTLATAPYWFFNHFHKLVFTSDEVFTSLRDFVQRDFSPKTSANTLKRDSALVLRMYSHSRFNDRVDLEDSLDSPLALLGLLHRIDSHSWNSNLKTDSDIPQFVLAFAIAELFKVTKREQFPIQDLMYSSTTHCAPGAVFRLNEESLVNCVDSLCRELDGILSLNRTAGVFQLYKLAALDPLSILSDRYSRKNRKLAA